MIADIPGWRNWQTRALEGRMFNDVGVQVPFRVQNSVTLNFLSPTVAIA